MDVKEIGINTRSSADLAQDRDYLRALVCATLNLWVAKAKELVSYLPHTAKSNLMGDSPQVI